VRERLCRRLEIDTSGAVRHDVRTGVRRPPDGKARLDDHRARPARQELLRRNALPGMAMRIAEDEHERCLGGSEGGRSRPLGAHDFRDAPTVAERVA
jgi:hypothetical protein